ncbi:acyloxyacyl hydrolase [Parapedobacter indicus]|uniref:Lipid A 3-O-deacylase (PagL) n=1 Tax=Parapedobacter indicus TaxID=1477437 RepID=A0A1I3PRB1_9SPHI|nr:acyloxyacyl hydrolase [Parapedobacter indicus]PPL00539.1 lipid A 3-O-deacylase PagL [Parapedobacter indicus]SFJ23867.1 Lipid A 3-O-deacylase (PagL) [Parapedobacter indicus]
MSSFLNLRLVLLSLLYPLLVFPQTGHPDSIEVTGLKRFHHQVAVTLRPAFVMPSVSFFDGVNQRQLPIKRSWSGHMNYSFGFPSGSLGSRVFSDTYQGIGVAYFDFGNRLELGSPLAAYMFQRSRITRINSQMSLDYEWNFGLSAGWQPYHPMTNPNNIIVGSKVNAYLNAGVHVRWKLLPRWAVMGGVDATHFSNGNTEFPNAGLNTLGVKMGVLYDFSPKESDETEQIKAMKSLEFPKHVSYDLVVFGSWKRTGVDFLGTQVASPYKYPVIGAYFAPMYNFGYRFRAGVSLDAIYDGSANVYTADYIVGTEQLFFTPDKDRQVALGTSIRGEYVMPIFTISLGLGANVLHKGGDLRGTYQAVALKVRVTRSSFLHIGHNLKDFREPNYVMLGMGYRFGNRTPSLLAN